MGAWESHLDFQIRIASRTLESTYHYENSRRYDKYSNRKILKIVVSNFEEYESIIKFSIHN